MSATQLSPSRRREDIRAWWAAHMKAQQDSGQSQVAYCRARGLDPKYFTLWKRKLREPRIPAKTVEPAQLVPVVVRTNRTVSASPMRPEKRLSEPTGIVALRLSLGNGISLSLKVATGWIPMLVRELAGLRC
ncbi:MAG TPA: hypothetical protein VNR65_07880 [Geobacterales bacterium]|nr:hypothetical protein [Geobacterales bacterium]